jgi:diguanylate cyclase (GGDEF)-like protein
MGEKKTADRRPGWPIRLRSWVRYGTGLRAKLIVLVLVIACLVVGALYWFSYASMRTLIVSIYEQRARSVAAIISKSIQEKDYILYYSEELNTDIDRLLERYESVVGITVIGVTARGFLSIASTDPSLVGSVATAEERDRLDALREVDVAPVKLRGISYLRAHHPIFSGPDLIGVVVVDMSLDEQARAISHLSWRFGGASVLGCLLLGGFLYLAMRGIVTRPVGQLAEAMGAVARRKYDVEVKHPFRRLPGTRLKDEVAHSHEQELMKLVVLDELTGAYTVDHLRTELERELGKTRRYKHPTSVLVVGIRGVEARPSEDRDNVLISTAGFLVSNLRNVDVLFRVGPFQFASLLPETPPAGAAVAAGRLRTQIPDVTAQFAFPVALDVRVMGWGEEGAPAIDEVLKDIVGLGETPHNET